MTHMPNTVRAIAELPPNVRVGSGSHLERRPSLGSVGEIVGDVEFRPGEHSARDINPNSFLGEVFGVPHVREVERGRPVMNRLIIDAFDANEHPAFKESKKSAAHMFAQELRGGIGETTDRLQVFTMSEEMNRRLHDMRPRFIRNDSEFEEATNRGLVFVVSDRFEALRQRSRFETSTLFAVKVNHQAEREIMAGIGFVSLGGWQEVNTNDSEQLAAKNAKLENQHQRIVSQLEQAGAVVVSIITAPSQPNLYDTAAADQALAEAIRSKQ